VFLTRGTLTKVIGACCGLGAFAVAVVAGIAAENPGEVVLFRALVSMFACQVVGLGVGMVIEQVIADSIKAHKKARPDPSVASGSAGGSPAGASGS
jgi:putative Mn2+ efflux pump MntP